MYPRVGVTSDGADNAPRLRVANGEDSKESKPPVKRRASTHTASPQDSSTPVPWRWRSRGARIRGLQRTRPFPPRLSGQTNTWFVADGVPEDRKYGGLIDRWRLRRRDACGRFLNRFAI